MKKTLFFTLTLLFATQMAFADGALGVAYDTFGKCDEQYYSVIKLKIKRPEAVPFTINNKGGKVEFSTGNLQYQATTRTFRFARRQWETVGLDGTTGKRATLVPWDSMILTEKAGTDPIEYDTTYETKISRNNAAGKKYAGWIDVFGWGTSGFKRTKIDNKDPYNTCIYPFSTSVSLSSAGTARTANYYGYGPSYGLTDVYGKGIDTTDAIARNYDWGQFNDVYCIWVGYDTTKTAGNTGYDTILFDSTMFQAGLWRTLTDTEWVYMLRTRKVENKKATPWAICGIKKATTTDFALMGGGTDPRAWDTDVDTVKGMFIFPDDFELETAVKLGFVSTEKASIVYGGGTTANAISYKSFMALEKLGVIFLPFTGYVSNTAAWTNTVYPYWSATAATVGTDKSRYSYAIQYNNTAFTDGRSQYSRCSRLSVRLVRDLDVSVEHPVSVFQ